MSVDIMGLSAMLAVMLGGTLLLVVIIVQLAATWRARAVAVREDAYRELAQRSQQVEEQLLEGVDELRGRVAEVERMLREVG
jgi:hypothetical protein